MATTIFRTTMKPARRLSLQKRNCDCCGGSNFEVVWHYQHSARTRNERYAFDVRNVLCRDCGFAFVSPVPIQADLDAYYNDALSKFGGQPMASSAEIRLNVLKQHGSPASRFAEIGSNRTSHFFLACAEYFKDAKSAELNVECDSEFTTIENIPNGSVDLLAHYYVIEHVADIDGFLRKCHSVLSDNGIMICEVPDIRAYEANIADLIFWEHLSHFSERSLTNIVIRRGFEALYVGHEGCSYPTGFLGVFRKVTAPAPAANNATGPNEFAETQRLLKRALVHVADFNNALQSLQTAILQHARSGTKVCIWGANDIMRRLVSPDIGAHENILLIDDDERKADFIDGATVYRPEQKSEHIRATGFFVITTDRVKNLILAKIARLAGREIPSSQIAILDWNYDFENNRSIFSS